MNSGSHRRKEMGFLERLVNPAKHDEKIAEMVTKQLMDMIAAGRAGGKAN